MGALRWMPKHARHAHATVGATAAVAAALTVAAGRRRPQGGGNGGRKAAAIVWQQKRRLRWLQMQRRQRPSRRLLLSSRSCGAASKQLAATRLQRKQPGSGGSLGVRPERCCRKPRVVPRRLALRHQARRRLRDRFEWSVLRAGAPSMSQRRIAHMRPGASAPTPNHTPECVSWEAVQESTTPLRRRPPHF